VLFRKVHLFGYLGLQFKVIICLEERGELFLRNFDVCVVTSHQKLGKMDYYLRTLFEEQKSSHNYSVDVC
jgi:hypothetical protein